MAGKRGLLLKAIVCAMSAISLSACAISRNPPPPSDGILRINPASLAADPAQADGRQVEVVGFLVWEFENLGLYQSYGAYCRGGEKTAIYVNWHDWPGVSRADNRRNVIVRGLFRDLQGVTQANGAALLSNGAPGPGPLEPGRIVRWLSKPMKPCPSARP